MFSFVGHIIDFILHIDVHLLELIAQYGVRVYGIIFWILFVETGLVIMPFLPGDSLLFAAGAFAALPDSGLDIRLLLLWSAWAAIIGDSVNYEIGHFVGPKAFSWKIKRLNQKHLRKTESFFDRYGGRAIIFARFVPIVRTFIPFVAGVGKMKYIKFLSYNIIWAIVWTAWFLLLGYYFWNIPRIQKNFSLAILIVIVLSVVPILVQWIYHRYKNN